MMKGYEYERGQFVTFTADELKALDVESTRTIDLATFVPRAEVDPVYFNAPWEGGINRADIMERFGVSVPQASKDLSLYEEKAPGNL
jgi:hypothetical protein